MTIPAVRPVRVRAFTLVELLVVIGIIAVLISMLLPALNSARRQAERAKCLASLQQTGQGFMLYAANWQGAWPLQRFQHTTPTTTRERRFYDFLSPYLLNGREINADGTNMNEVAAVDIKDGNNVIWGCPTWRRMVNVNGTFSDVTIHTGYNMNIYPFAPDDTDPPKGALRVNQFKVAQQNVDGSNYNQGKVASYSGLALMGKFFKQSAWKKPSERALMFDAVHPLTVLSNTQTAIDYINAWPYAPENASGPAFPLEPNAAEIGLDWNRHGKNQKRTDESTPSMNMLFCDGHADFVSARQAFRAIRFK
jgi:prepilin-type N-terminal cleavage/methylation domain-containing protein/prepilin-type processing-associated H-X9-DG protein